MRGGKARMAWQMPAKNHKSLVARKARRGKLEMGNDGFSPRSPTLDP